MENRKINPKDYDDPMELVKDSIGFYTEGEGQQELNEILESMDMSEEETYARNEQKLHTSVIDSLDSKEITNSRNKEMIDKMKQKRIERMAHLTVEELGVLNRQRKDYESAIKFHSVVFAGADHPIFNRLIDLANQYPSRSFIVSSIRELIEDKKEEIEVQIQIQEKNLKTIERCELLSSIYPDDWENKIIEELGQEALDLYQGNTIETVESNIKKMKNSKAEIDKWKTITSKIKEKPQEREVPKIQLKNNLYYEILDEFNRVFELCQTVGHVSNYKAYIHTEGFNKVDLLSALTRELEKQVGLCEEATTHNMFYSNNEGRLVPYHLNRQFLRYVNENTTFYKYNANGHKTYKSGDIISVKDLFEEVPSYCNKYQYRNQSLVGFNNCFYNIDTNDIVPLNPRVPVLPLKNCQTELYLDEEIERNPMQHILEECFSKKDRKTLLAYVGCCLYDKGYTQRQESLFLMGCGGVGKTSLVKAICSIFYNVGNQLVTKLKSNNEFALSVFADNDIVIIDEVQAAHRDFANFLKNISGGGNLPIERKYQDTINMPASNIPRMFLIGNNFSKALYEESDGEGVSRRILIIIPTKPIQNLGYKWDDLVSKASQQWLVQAATKEYIMQGLHNSNKPIEFDEAEKKERLEMCVHPEQYFVAKHFEYIEDEYGNCDMSETITYDDLFDFAANQINLHMVESTCKKEAPNMFIGEVRDALGIPESHYTKNYNGVLTFTSVAPKTEEAIEFLAKRHGDDLNE